MLKDWAERGGGKNRLHRVLSLGWLCWAAEGKPGENTDCTPEQKKQDGRIVSFPSLFLRTKVHHITFPARPHSHSQTPRCRDSLGKSSLLDPFCGLLLGVCYLLIQRGFPPKATEGPGAWP